LELHKRGKNTKKQGGNTGGNILPLFFACSRHFFLQKKACMYFYIINSVGTLHYTPIAVKDIWLVSRHKFVDGG
jgi:hypothetical protein